MKFSLATKIITLLHLSLTINGSKIRPGQCETNDDCLDGHLCISVKNKIATAEKTSQCITKTPMCGGDTPGYCPTFSSWPRKYQQIQPVCAFVDPGNCTPEKDMGKPSKWKSDRKFVDCSTIAERAFNGSDVDSNVDVKIRKGIYKCIDLPIYKAEDRGYGFTDQHLENCKGKSSSALLCNGQGTCSPLNQANFLDEMEYQCRCNAGYGEADNCDKVQSNECDSYGQCGAAGSCNIDDKDCKCDDGVAGDQCTACTSDEGCNNNGVCQEDGTCKCTDGYNGEFCKGPLSSKGTNISLTYSVITLNLIFTTIVNFLLD